MKVNTESTSRKSLIHAGEVELVEFFVQRPAGDDQDHEIACSDARALVRAADGDAVADSARLVVGKVMNRGLIRSLRTADARTCLEKELQ
jgi:hypothetical protein